MHPRVYTDMEYKKEMPALAVEKWGFTLSPTRLRGVTACRVTLRFNNDSLSAYWSVIEPYVT